MFWSILPFFLAVVVLWLSTKFNLGNFESDEFGNLLVPESTWAIFKSFLIVLMGLGVPAFLIASLAKRRIKLDNRLYPNSRMKSWAHSLDEDMWTVVHIFAGTLLAMVVITVIIFS